MKYKVYDSSIEITEPTCFNPKHICECGQMFRFACQDDGSYFVCSGENRAKIAKTGEKYVIFTKNPEYFVKFFDLNYDYDKAKKQLSTNLLLKDAISYGDGIRIAKADEIEAIVEFIISANNNIKRIQKIVEKLCEVGEQKQDEFGKYFAFPSVKVLAKQGDEWFNSLGAGYRAPYLKETVNLLAKTNIEDIKKLSSSELYKWLLSLKGVGPKVASCILLFGFGRKEYFPVDTWVEQVYYNHFSNEKRTRTQIQKYFENMFGEYSGLAQQYLFYAERG
ncbi:MAG: 8-oxoguanine DNA glycosylase [Clostridia bacterium]|nr:8-oxoguanine DNA glycosylase [Clostridia bacterium]